MAPSQRSEVTATGEVIAKNVQNKAQGGSAAEKRQGRSEQWRGVSERRGEERRRERQGVSEVARRVVSVRSVKNDLTYATRSSLR